MLSQFQASYQRMEQSLQRLTDSIAAYNPSTTAADDLVAADDALTVDIEQLIQHQRNVLRIEQLKRTAQENNERIRKHFEAVALLRKELESIPSTDTTTSTREVGVDELLSYARFISPTTVPPTFRRQDAPLKAVNTEPADVQMANGIATPPATTQEADSNPPYIKSSGVGMEAIPAPERAWLQANTESTFEPWPTPPHMAAGILGDIQRMLEQGRDPASVLSKEEQAEVERRRREEEERERLEEEERQRRRMNMFDVRRRARDEANDVFDPDA